MKVAEVTEVTKIAEVEDTNMKATLMRGSCSGPKLMSAKVKTSNVKSEWCGCVSPLLSCMLVYGFCKLYTCQLLPSVYRAAWYNTWLLKKLTLKGGVFSFLFFSSLFFSSLFPYLWLVNVLAVGGRSAAWRVLVNEGVKAAVMLLVEPVITIGRV